MTDERNNVHFREALFDNACEITSEFEIEESRPRVDVRIRQRNRELSCRQPIWLLEDITIPCLLGSFNGRDIKTNSKQRGAFFGILSKPSKSWIPVHLTPEINDKIVQCLSERFSKESRFCWCGWAL